MKVTVDALSTQVAKAQTYLERAKPDSTSSDLKLPASSSS
jgi:hypothetical protein